METNHKLLIMQPTSPYTLESKKTMIMLPSLVNKVIRVGGGGLLVLVVLLLLRGRSGGVDFGGEVKGKARQCDMHYEREIKMDRVAAEESGGPFPLLPQSCAVLCCALFLCNGHLARLLVRPHASHSMRHPPEPQLYPPSLPCFLPCFHPAAILDDDDDGDEMNVEEEQQYHNFYVLFSVAVFVCDADFVSSFGLLT